MKYLLLFLISLYRNFISPFKGFSCAYRVHTGRASCSALGYRSIRYFGVLRGLVVLRKRLSKCGTAHRRFSRAPRHCHKQAGFCDMPCDLPVDLPCEVSACHHNFDGAVCDVLTTCMPCDCGDWRSSRKQRSEEKYVYIPPNSKHLRPSKD